MSKRSKILECVFFWLMIMSVASVIVLPIIFLFVNSEHIRKIEYWNYLVGAIVVFCALLSCAPLIGSGMFRTPGNILINILFYLFIVVWIISSNCYTRYKKKNVTAKQLSNPLKKEA